MSVNIIAGNPVDPHINDPDDAHDAEAISYVPTVNVHSNNVQAAIDEVAEVAIQASVGTIPDGSITEEKLAFDPVTQEELVIYGSQVHTQIAAASVWVIPHTLPFFPQISVVDTAGTVQYGDVEYINASTIQVTFSAPFSGKAYLS